MLQYPSNLDTSDAPFIKITAYEWSVRGKKTNKTQSTKTIIETIFLPISRNGISETITNSWDTSEQITKSSASEFAAGKIGQVVKSRIGDLGKFVEYQTGQILNDYSALTFSGNNFREFTLTYNLIPQSSSEADTVKSIVDTFKRNSLPEYAGFKVLYPRFWRIEMYIPNGESPVVFNDCVLIDISSDYFQNNNLVVFNDGNVSVDISLSFREIQRLSRSNI